MFQDEDWKGLETKNCIWIECKSWTNSTYKIKVGGKCYGSIKKLNCKN
jgi:hypothetical protein